MRRSYLAIFLTLALPLCAAAQSSPNFSSLEERMSAADFRRAGLDKLTPEELAALNAWLQARETSPGAAPTEDRAGFASSNFFGANGPDRIESTVAGNFKGWDRAGDLITLANGQVWRVTDSSTRLRVDLSNPRVVIERNAMGGWQLRVDGYNTRARVTRER